MKFLCIGFCCLSLLIAIGCGPFVHAQELCTNGEMVVRGDPCDAQIAICDESQPWAMDCSSYSSVSRAELLCFNRNCTVSRRFLIFDSTHYKQENRETLVVSANVGGLPYEEEQFSIFVMSNSTAVELVDFFIMEKNITVEVNESQSIEFVISFSRSGVYDSPRRIYLSVASSETYLHVLNGPVEVVVSGLQTTSAEEPTDEISVVEDGEGLSTGAVVGIVFGVLIAVAVVAALVVLLLVIVLVVRPFGKKTPNQAKQDDHTKLEESTTASDKGDTIVKITSKDDVLLKEVHLHGVEKS